MRLERNLRIFETCRRIDNNNYVIKANSYDKMCSDSLEARLNHDELKSLGIEFRRLMPGLDIKLMFSSRTPSLSHKKTLEENIPNSKDLGITELSRRDTKIIDYSLFIDTNKEYGEVLSYSKVIYDIEMHTRGIISLSSEDIPFYSAKFSLSKEEYKTIKKMPDHTLFRIISISLSK